MSEYFNVRGYLDCDFEQIEEIKSIVSNVGSEIEHWKTELERLDLYRTGWLYPSTRMNWISHVFYGGCVRADGVDLIKVCLQEISAHFPAIDGQFFIDDDEGEVREILELADGEVRRALLP